MDITEIIAASREAVRMYCNGDTSQLRELAAPSCKWWCFADLSHVSEPPPLQMQASKFLADAVQIGDAGCVVTVTAIGTDGGNDLRAVLCWSEIEKKALIVMCQLVCISQNMPTSRLSVRTVQKTQIMLELSQIMWIESNGRHSVLHLTDGLCNSIESISRLTQRYPNVFLRCHSSYLVNPAYVCTIARFKLEMADGTQIPVPEKKYYGVKRWLTERSFPSKTVL